MDLEREAIDFFLKENVLKFGDFTLKSGRKSPYFFNTGSLCTGYQLAKLGSLYARRLQQESIFNDADVVFGSAYKGIPIAVSTAIALASTNRAHLRAVSDRKEAKTHGDTGGFLGVMKSGDKIVIVDDVITTGGTKMEAIEKLRDSGARPLGLIIAFDRAERVDGSSLTAKESFERETGLPVFALATVHDIGRVRPDVQSIFEDYLAHLA